MIAVTTRKLAVITPIGPGHQHLSDRAFESVKAASERGKGPFQEITWIGVDDEDGTMGRGGARNYGLQVAREEKADWVFWLDADDTMLVDAFEILEPWELEEYDAIWGWICSSGRPRPGQRLPFTWQELVGGDPFVGLQIGYFIRREVQEMYRWREDMKVGEDYEMYLRLWYDQNCTKVQKSFFDNHRGSSAEGPNAATGGEWRKVVLQLQKDASFWPAPRTLAMQKDCE